MPAKRPQPVYLIMLSTGDIEYHSAREAIAAAEKDLLQYPTHRYLVVQKIATVEAEQARPTPKTTRHY